MEVILNINDLNDHNLLKNITLSIEKGKIITIAGPNNCGKTTLCRILDRKMQGDFNINLKGKDIKEYSLEEYENMIQIIYPSQVIIEQDSPKGVFESKNIPKDKLKWIEKEAKREKILEKESTKLTRYEKVLTRLLYAIGKSEELVILDGIDSYLSKKEVEKLIEIMKKSKKQFSHTFILFTTSLEEAVLTDELYIIKNGEILLQGEPLTILQKDNMINKAGLNVPFMIDLSVKLRDYELIKKVELDKEKLVDQLWN